MQGDGGQKSTFPVHVLSPDVCEGLALAARLFRGMTARSVGSRLHAACLGRFADAVRVRAPGCRLTRSSRSLLEPRFVRAHAMPASDAAERPTTHGELRAGSGPSRPRPVGVGGAATPLERSSSGNEGRKLWVQLSSGVGSSVVAALATTPFDVVKTRMQVCSATAPAASTCLRAGLNGGDRSVGSSVLRACCILHPESGGLCAAVGGAGRGAALLSSAAADALDLRATTQRTSAYKTAVAIARAEGLPALWRGTGANVVACIPSVGIYMATYEQLKFRINQSAVLSTHAAPLLAGGMARTIAVVGTAPLELMRTRVMAQSGVGAVGGMGILLRAVAHDGWRSLWRGTSPTLYRDVPFSALYWVAAEAVRERLWRRWGASSDALVVNVTAGFIAGAVASATTHPFDVIKTRAQVQEGGADRSALVSLRRVMVKEGWSALWDGLGPRVLKVGPSCAIVLASYELFKGLLAAPT